MATDRSLRLLDKLASEGRTAFTASEIQDALELSPQATSNVLGRLVEAGLVDRVTSGRYAIRQIGALGTAAVWDDLGSAVAAVFAGHPHRIGYLTALDHHGLLIRPVRAIQVASAYRPRSKALAGRALRVIRENPLTILVGTEPLGPSRVATIERALLDAASRPRLVSGAWRVAEALAAVTATEGLAELAHEVGAEAGYRRIGSISTALSLPVCYGLEPEPWRTLVDLDTTVLREHGWVDKTWGVAWPYPVSRLEAVVAS